MKNRLVCWFSAGAASASATKITLDRNPDAIVARIVLDNEHPDNERFSNDCEKWFGKKIVKLRSEKYRDCWEVWEKRRFLNSPNGALCTVELKKKVRQAFQLPDDVHIMGFTIDEKKRSERFRENNHEIECEFPLVDLGYTKHECFLELKKAGILLPAMYRLGYKNANCVGCVKGGMGYWNKIRNDFPLVFERMANLEIKLEATVLKDRSLRELKVGDGRHESFNLPDCGLFCSEENNV